MAQCPISGWPDKPGHDQVGLPGVLPCSKKAGLRTRYHLREPFVVHTSWGPDEITQRGKARQRGVICVAAI
jgi:hypothetical protein